MMFDCRKGPRRLLADRKLSSGKSFLQKISSDRDGDKTVHSLPSLITRDGEFGNLGAVESFIWWHKTVTEWYLGENK